MKIYIVSYIGMDDLTYNEHFSNKGKAVKRRKKLKDYEDKVLNEEEDNPAKCKMVYELHEHECEISKNGILQFLNMLYGETG